MTQSPSWLIEEVHHLDENGHPEHLIWAHSSEGVRLFLGPLSEGHRKALGYGARWRAWVTQRITWEVQEYVADRCGQCVLQWLMMRSPRKDEHEDQG